MTPKESLGNAVNLLHKELSLTRDEIVFEKLYLLLYAHLHRFALHIIKSRHIADEIVSDVFVQLWNKNETISEIKNLRLFLYVAIKNRSLTYLYRMKKDRFCWIENYAEATVINVKLNAEDVLIAKELQEKIDLAIKKLPPKCRAIFKLVKEDGLKYREAASLLNLSVKTVENQMGNAVKKIAAVLKYTYHST